MFVVVEFQCKKCIWKGKVLMILTLKVPTLDIKIKQSGFIPGGGNIMCVCTNRVFVCNKEPVCKAVLRAFSCQTSAISIHFILVPCFITIQKFNNKKLVFCDYGKSNPTFLSRHNELLKIFWNVHCIANSDRIFLQNEQNVQNSFSEFDVSFNRKSFICCNILAAYKQLQGKRVSNRAYVPKLTLVSGLDTNNMINVLVTLPVLRANII